MNMYNTKVGKIWRIFDRAVFLIILLLYRFFGKEYTSDKHKAFMQFIKFCFVGATNAVVYYLVYAGSLLLFRRLRIFGELDYQISQVLGFASSVFWAFSMNRKHVFGFVNEPYFVALGRFYLTYAFTGLFMNSALLYLWKYIGISEFIGPLINIFFTTPINFFMAKLWAFRKT